MTKKKNGFFSKIKDRFKKDDEHLDDELHENEYEDEYEDEYEELEDEEDSEYDEEDQEDSQELEQQPEIPLPPIAETPQESEDEYDEEDEGELSNPDSTIEIEIPEVPKQGLFAKVKNKLTSTKESSNDEDEDDNEYEEYDEETDDQVKKPILEALLDRVKNFKQPLAQSSLTKKSAPLSLKEMPYDQWLPYLLGEAYKEKIHKVFIASLCIITCLQIGKFAALSISTKTKSKKTFSTSQSAQRYNPRADVAVIRDNNIFNAKEDDSIIKKGPTKPKDDGPKVCIASTKKTNLPLKLLNTIVLQDSVKSVASVSQRGKIFSYREGDKMDSMAQIGKIDRLKVVFKNLKTNDCEYLENIDPKAQRFEKKNKSVVHKGNTGKHLLPKKEGIGKDGNKYTIKKGLRDSLLSNIGDVLTQAKAIQIKNSDGTLSFKMTSIVPGSIYSQLDIQNDDIITGINGKKFTNLNDLMGMFGKLKQNDSYDISLKRNGTEQNLNYNFVD